MGFTVEGLKEQRLDILSDISKIEVLDTEGEYLCELDSTAIEPIDLEGNPLIFKMVARGVDVGVGNTVGGFNLYKGDTVLYTANFEVKNQCVTEQDTFTFTFKVGN